MIVSFHELLQLAGIFAIFTSIVHLYQTWILRQMKRDSVEAQKAISQSMEEGNRGTQEILREIGLHTKGTHEKVIDIHEKVVS